MAATAAASATELVGGAAPLFHDPAGGSLRDVGGVDPVAKGDFARPAPEPDSFFAVDAALLANRAEPAPAERNPFAWASPLIVFAGLTALFARKKSGGRGLIAA